MIQLLVCDVDGVLYKEGKPVEETLMYIKKLQRRGVFCTLATGMAYPRVQQKLKHFTSNCPMVLDDGGKIVAPDGTVIKSFSIPSSDIMFLVEHLDLQNISMAAFSGLDDHRYVCFVGSEDGRQFVERGLDKQSLLKVTDNSFQFWQAALHYGCTRFTFKPKLGSFVTVPPTLRMVQNEDKWNVTLHGVDKSTGVVEICKLQGLDVANAIVVGNDFNDLPLFGLNCPYRIAIGDKSEELMQLATHALATPSELVALLQNIFKQGG